MEPLASTFWRCDVCEELAEFGPESEAIATTCGHVACHRCLRSHIEAQLPRCLAEGSLHVQCPAAGCAKGLPHRLLYRASRGARETAALIDAGVPSGELLELCPTCEPAAAGQPRFLLRLQGCKQGACEDCWARWAAKRVEAARVELTPRACRCLCEDCSEIADADFWAQELALVPAAQHCAALHRRLAAERARAGPLLIEPPPWPEAPPLCVVCRDPGLLLQAGDHGAEHAACEACWRQWAESQLDRCVDERRLAVRCLGERCKTPITDGLWRLLCQRSDALGAMARGLDRRERLKGNQNYPACMQVNCPQPGCLGIGYLGFDTVMCFVCEHLWTADGEPPPSVDVEVVMGVAVKRCPSCNEYIEKNGGCDHMTCKCKHEFYWTTLKPFRG